MKRWTSPRQAGLCALSAALVLSACSGGTQTPAEGDSSGTVEGGTATVNLVSAPGTLDPGLAYTAQSQDAVWLVNTGLLTYKHVDGAEGGTVVPGLATDMPVISPDGKTYTLTLREDLKYSNGVPAKPEDFSYGIQRAIKLNWGGVSFFTTFIKGAEEYQAGTSDTISGITSDPATNKITVELVRPYGPFTNVLAFTASALVPTGTPMTHVVDKPPPGIGPYMFENVQPGRSFDMVKTPGFADLKLPNIPVGSLDRISVLTQTNPLTAAQDVLQNKVDAYDPSNPVPASLLQTIEQTASDRFETVPTAWTFYFWMNTTLPPFDNKDARLAVSEAVDRKALQRLSNGFLTPGCRFIPPTVPGHVDGECAGQAGGGPDIEKAKALVAGAGLTGAPVTVWGPNSSPRNAYVDYYTGVLNEIGFKATSKLTTAAVYGPTIGAAATMAQTGYGDWSLDFPHPSSFFTPLRAASINPEHNINYSNINDPVIEAGLQKLNLVPTSELDTVSAEWAALDKRVVEEAYEFPFGYGQLPKLLSNRIDFDSAVFHPIYFNDYSSWKLKK